MGFFVEYIDKTFTDDFTFLFRLGHSGQRFIEFLFCIYPDHIQSQMLVIFHHVLKLVLAQQAVIDEDTSEIFTDCLVQQYGCNGRIHTAR